MIKILRNTLPDNETLLLTGIIVPPLPEKSAVQKFQMTTEFIESRRRALQVFINRVVRGQQLTMPLLYCKNAATAYCPYHMTLCDACKQKDTSRQPGGLLLPKYCTWPPADHSLHTRRLSDGCPAGQIIVPLQAGLLGAAC